ncbi:unnamed protein product [Bursaphelenchus okinawaensis]|uniref:DnaJ homolog subfamily B member 9 n=1 Tax=Bursaphelenchus okinawaensis TaxID=465554 RepID=A0A811L442_9BILA|nr:unnamed protein product [Bursaphelenchus okinawaensis]CAG9119105.1 unnamed protein product [Bursaphelenchus okinawaensis]
MRIFIRSYSSIRDPYTILGVKRDSTVDEVKEAYYTLSKKYHPDSVTADAAKFLAIKSAYEKLKDNKVENGVQKLHTFTMEDLRKVNERFDNYNRDRVRDYSEDMENFKKSYRGDPEVGTKQSLWKKTLESLASAHIVLKVLWCAILGGTLGATTFFRIQWSKMEEYKRKNPHLIYE